MKFSIMVGRFPFGAVDHPDVTDWLIRTAITMSRDPRVDRVVPERKDDTPITMGRNWMVERAKKAKVDYLLMVDSDMNPDTPLPGAKPFWDSTIDFMLNHNGPCAVAAPYCGPPPLENVYVFQWANWQNDNPNPDCRLEQYTREQAATLGGIQRVSALPTGLILIDMRCFERIKPPYFYYEYKDEALRHEKASTEDVTFTRDLDMAGVPVYCNWDAWAGHWKKKCVTKPQPIYSETIQKKYREAVLADVSAHERLIVLGEGSNDGPQRNGSPAAPALAE